MWNLNSCYQIIQIVDSKYIMNCYFKPKHSIIIVYLEEAKYNYIKILIEYVI